MAEQYFITESRCTQASKSQQHLLMAQHVEQNPQHGQMGIETTASKD
jgi:hypothetical protein